MSNNDRICARLYDLIANSDNFEDMVIYSTAADKLFYDYVLTKEQASILKNECMDKIFKFMEGNKNA